MVHAPRRRIRTCETKVPEKTGAAKRPPSQFFPELGREQLIDELALLGEDAIDPITVQVADDNPEPAYTQPPETGQIFLQRGDVALTFGEIGQSRFLRPARGRTPRAYRSLSRPRQRG